MNTQQTLKKAKEFEACQEAIEWLETLPPDVTPWDICEQGDWMLSFAVKVGVDRKLIVTAACRCARLSLRFVPDGEERPLNAIETHEAWVRGKATSEQVRAAADAAWAAAAAAADAAADAAAYRATKKEWLKKCADIVREVIPSIDQ